MIKSIMYGYVSIVHAIDIRLCLKHKTGKLNPVTLGNLPVLTDFYNLSNKQVEGFQKAQRRRVRIEENRYSHREEAYVG